jgi:hypothetical protein
MADSPSSRFDEWLERFSKIAGILLPLVVFIVGYWYNTNKDRNDAYQQQWDNTQKQYSNLTALVPWLTSQNLLAVSAGLAIYTSEAKTGQAPLDLYDTILNIPNEQPKLAGAVQGALDAAKVQMGKECKFNPAGIYIHVANSSEQLASGQLLANFLREAGFTVQGVQRVNVAPKSTQLRYYFSDTTDSQAKKIIDNLGKHGFGKVDPSNLSPTYLKQGCPPPGIYELWIGTATPLAADGSGTK